MQPHKRGDWYHVEFRHEGRRIRKALGTQNQKDAKRKAAEIYRRALAGLPIEDEPETPTPTVADLLEDYLEELTRRDRAHKHIADVRKSIAKILKDAEAVTIDELTTPAIERAMSYLSDRAPATQNRCLGYLKSWLRWLNKTGRWDRNPAAPIDAIREQRRNPARRALTPDEAHQLTSDERIPLVRRVAYMLALTTGLRRGEIKALGHSDFDLERGEVTIQAAAAKNRKAATLPLTAACVAAIRAWQADPTFMVGNRKHTSYRAVPVAPDTRTLRKDLELLGIPHETPEGVIDFHALRVTFGSLLARNGTPLVLAQRLLRHSSPELTANIYTRFHSEDRRSAVDGVGEMIEGPHKSPHKKRTRGA